MRLRRWSLLRKQHVQRHEHHLQELSLCGVRYAGYDLFDGNPVLRGQRLYGWLLRDPLQHYANVRQSIVHVGRRGLRHPVHEHDQPRVRPDHGRWRLVHISQHHDLLLRRPRASLLRLQLLLHFNKLLLLWRPWQSLPFQHVVNHRQHAVPVHSMRQQGPAVLCRFIQLKHELGHRLQGPIHVRLRLQ